jgi:hypothetical protein
MKQVFAKSKNEKQLFFFNKSALEKNPSLMRSGWPNGVIMNVTPSLPQRGKQHAGSSP